MTRRRVPALARAVVLASGAVVFASGARLAGQQATFSTRTDAIQVDVLVTANGRPVGGLQAADFEILDNGVPQQVQVVTSEQIPLNIVLAFDISDSTRRTRLDDLRFAGNKLLDALTPRDRAALVTFSQVIALGSPLTRDFDALRRALDRLEPEGQTSLIDAAHAAMMLGESDVGRSLVLVFTDGLDTSSWLTPDTVLETARRTDVVVCGVAVAHTPDSFLAGVTSATGGTLVNLASTENLERTFLRLLDEFRQRYLLSYSPRAVPKSGWHRLEVRVKGRRAAVKARPGYLAGS